ncbi:MAG: ATP-binding protein [Thermoanaerobaculia bacterium]
MKAADTALVRSLERQLPLTLTLLAAVAVVSVLSIRGIVAARSDVRRVAEAELVLDTEARARALEGSLDTLSRQLGILAGSRPLLAHSLLSSDATDAQTRRWARIDLEGALLLFLSSQPAIERLDLAAADGRSLAVAARRRGAPVLLPPQDEGAAAPGSWLGRFPVAGGATLEARLSREALLAATFPGFEGRLALVPEGAPESQDAALSARASFRANGWSPPLVGVLVRREEESRLLDSVENLSRRYRLSILASGAVLVLTLGLGLFALAQTRRRALLEAEKSFEAERRQLESRLYHSERLSSLGRLAAGMAHEVNNPLEGMGNYLTLLEEDLAGGRQADAQRHLARVREGLARAAGAVRGVLTFAAPGRSPAEPMDLSALLAETVEFTRGNPAFAGIEIHLEAPAGPVPLVGHRVTLGQLFLNLLLNACQAQPGGGRIEVTLGASEAEAEVTVRDRGPGLAEEVQARLFEPFVSTRGSTGLGLAVCHGIVAAHSGSITGANAPGGGALFRVRLPRRPQTFEEA